MRWLVALAFLLSAGHATADPGDLRRLTLRQDRLGWEGVGRLDFGERGHCTGSLIATDLVLTAAHCVFGPKGVVPRAPETVTFRAGYADGVAVAERMAARIVVHPGYDPGAGASLENMRHDVALIELASPIPAATAAPFAVAAPAPGKPEVSVVSYGVGRLEALSWQRRCSVVGRRDGILAFDCDVELGSSGAPVFDRTGPRPRIVAIVSAGSHSEEGTIALGMELTAVVDELRTLLRGRPANGQPESRRLRAGETAPEGGARFLRP